MTVSPPRKPSLLFVSQFYHPDVAAVGQHLSDLAEFLADRGHAVTVYAAFPAYGDRGSEPVAARERRNGVTIRRFRSTAFGRSTHLGRIADYAAFYVQVFAAIMIGRGFDGVVFLTTPPLIGLVGLMARAMRGQRYAIWSMDLHPAAEFAAGMLRRESLPGRILQALWRASHRRADFTVSLGEFMSAHLVADGVKARRIAVVPPWSAADDFTATPDEIAQYRDALGVGDRFVVMYSGNAGLLHDFGAICEAMSLLAADDSIVFVFIGGGPRRRQLEEFAAARRLPNVIFRGYEDRARIGCSIAAADAHLVSLLKEFAGIAVPSKVYGVMAAGRPTLYVGPINSEPAHAILRSGGGEVVDPASPGPTGQRVVDIIRRWQADPAERRRFGDNARRAFCDQYEMSKGSAAFAAVVDAHWGGSAGR